MKAKYIRVSSVSQNTERQEQTPENVKLFIDKISGTVPFAERTSAKKLIKEIESKKIDEVSVHSIDRLGRNQIDILNTIQFFKDNNCQLFIENLGVSLLTPSKKESSAFNIIVSVMSSLAEMERVQIKERQGEGIAIAKAKGKYVGRSVGSTESSEKILGKHSDIVKCFEKKMSIRDTAEIVKKSKTTVQKIYSILRKTPAL